MELFLNTFYFLGDVPNDLVGFTFFIGTMAMMAASVFFFLSLNAVDAKWRNSILVSGLITFIAAVHYNYMRDVDPGDTTFFRYVDWILTVPLMCVEFYLILKVAGATKSMMWKLILWSTVMLVTGFFGEFNGGSALGLGPAIMGSYLSGSCILLSLLTWFGLEKLKNLQFLQVEQSKKHITL